MITIFERRRRELGLSQLELAKKMGFSSSLISRYECGFLNLVSERFKVKAAKVLLISKKELFDESPL